MKNPKLILFGIVGALVLGGVCFVFFSGGKSRRFVDSARQNFQRSELRGRSSDEKSDGAKASVSPVDDKANGKGAEAALMASLTNNAPANPSPSNSVVGRAADNSVRSVVPIEVAKTNAVEGVEEAQITPPKDKSMGSVMDISLAPTDTPAPPVPRSLIEAPVAATPPSNSVGVPGSQAKVYGEGRYRFNNQSKDALNAKGLVVSEKKETYDLDQFATYGDDIELAFIDNVVTGDSELDVKAGVWLPFISLGKTLLKGGEQIVGKASPGKKRDRCKITWERIILLDKRSIPIKGRCVATDGSEGVQGKIVGDLFLQAAGPLLIELAKGVAENFKDRYSGTTISAGGFQIDATKQNLTNAGINGGQKVLDKLAEIMAADLEENKPFLVVYAGTRCKARLLAPLDLSQVDYGK